MMSLPVAFVVVAFIAHAIGFVGGYYTRKWFG